MVKSLAKTKRTIKKTKPRRCKTQKRRVGGNPKTKTLGEQLLTAIFTYRRDNMHEKLPLIKDLIEKGAYKEDFGRGSTPLSSAIYIKLLPIVELLLEKGVDVNAERKGRGGETYLHFAVEGGDLPIVKLLVKHGAVINARGESGSTPLHTAAARSNLPIVKFLVEHGANINQANNRGDIPLYYAAAWGNIPTVKFLVEHGADVNQANNRGDTSLHNAVISNYLPVVEFLVEKDANINQANKAGNTPLHLAAEDEYVDEDDEDDEDDYEQPENRLPIVNFLLANGADYAKRNNANQMPIDMSLKGSPIYNALATAREQTQAMAIQEMENAPSRPNQTTLHEVPEVLKQHIASYLGGSNCKYR